MLESKQKRIRDTHSLDPKKSPYSPKVHSNESRAVNEDAVGKRLNAAMPTNELQSNNPRDYLVSTFSERLQPFNFNEPLGHLQSKNRRASKPTTTEECLHHLSFNEQKQVGELEENLRSKMPYQVHDTSFTPRQVQTKLQKSPVYDSQT